MVPSLKVLTLLFLRSFSNKDLSSKSSSIQISALLFFFL
jgi:hypothetical protein